MRAAEAASESLLLDIPQTATLLNVSPRMVEYLISRGELSSLRVGRCRRVTRAEIVAYVDRLVAEQLSR